MNTYTIHTAETAPESARQSVAGLSAAFGFVPNAVGAMANSPALVNAFFAAFGQFRGLGTFSAGERQVLLLSNAVANDCPWAVAFHSTLALEDGIPQEEVDAIRRRELPEDPGLSALSALTRTLIDKRGRLDEADAKAFTAAGFEDDQILEVITGVAISAMANYTAHVTRPPLEAPFQAQAWDGSGSGSANGNAVGAY
jgi:uncharacterized peroxidase-related enzyme